MRADAVFVIGQVDAIKLRRSTYSDAVADDRNDPVKFVADRVLLRSYFQVEVKFIIVAEFYLNRVLSFTFSRLF